VNKVKEFLENNWHWLRFILVGVAILHQTFFLYHTSRLGWDELVQLGQARNFVNGHNFSLATTTLNNLGDIVYTVDVHFPIGYTSLLSLGLVFTDNPLVVEFFWASFATFLFFLAWFVILELCGKVLQIHTRFAIWMYWALVVPPMWSTVYTDHTTTYLPLALMATALACALWAIQDRRRLWMKIAAGGTVMGLAAPIHYIFWPLLAAIPGALIAFGWLYKERRLWTTAGILFGALSGVSLLGVLLFNLAFTGAPYDPHFPFDGPHWDHLLRTAPVPLAIFGFSYPVFRLPHVPPESNIHPPLFPFLDWTWVFSGLMLLIALWSAWRTLKPSSDSPTTLGSGRMLYLSGLFTGMILYVFLAYRSVFMELDGWVGGWVFVQDIRHFSAVVPLLGVAVFHGLMQPPKWQWAWFRSGNRLAFISIILGSIIFIGSWRVALTWQQATDTDHTPRLGPTYYDDNPIIAPIYRAFDQFGQEMPSIFIQPTGDTELRLHAQAVGLPVIEVPIAQINESLDIETDDQTLVIVGVYAFSAEYIPMIEAFAERYNAKLVGYEPFRIFAFVASPASG